jgi:hypothetical protein
MISRSKVILVVMTSWPEAAPDNPASHAAQKTSE